MPYRNLEFYSSRRCVYGTGCCWILLFSSYFLSSQSNYTYITYVLASVLTLGYNNTLHRTHIGDLCNKRIWKGEFFEYMALIESTSIAALEQDSRCIWFGYKYRGIVVWEPLRKQKLSDKCVHRVHRWLDVQRLGKGCVLEL